MDREQSGTPSPSRVSRAGRAVHLLCAMLFITACAALPASEWLARDGLQTGIEEGQRAPDFELKDLNGAQIRLSDYRGQVVLINFWATWCGHCRTEFPEIQKAFERNREKGLVVLAVNVQDRKESVQAYAQELGLTFPVLLDPLGRATTLYRARRLPTSYFVGPKGIIVRKQVGPVDLVVIEDVLEQVGVD